MTVGMRSLQLCRWVDAAACAARPDLPWVADAENVTDADRDAMAAVCSTCPALDMTAGWAGCNRGPAPEMVVTRPVGGA